MKLRQGANLNIWRHCVVAIWLGVTQGCSSLPQAADQQSPDPQLLEAVRWYTGETGTVDDNRARVLLEAAAADRDPLSVMWLARVYSTGRMTYPADKAQAVELAAGVIDTIETLAMRGIPEAQFLLGTAYAEGLGKRVDAAAAAAWYLRAAEARHVLAQHNLGNVYFAGTGVQQDYAQAAAWWQLAAEQGDAIPQFRLGGLYEEGLGVEPDPVLARRWYTDAAQRGNANARIALERLAALPETEQ